jgi:type IV secretion system protein TrbF
MAHPFKRSSTRYGTTPEPATPYQRAAQVWDDRIGSARVQARTWRYAALGAIGSSAFMALAVALTVGRTGVVPYVVEVDRLGEVRAVGPAIETYHPADAQIAHFLARFIEDVRGISIDPVVVRANWLQAYDYATDRAAQTLNDYARETDPFARIGTRTIGVEVNSVVRASNDSFEIRWKEVVTENGAIQSTQRYTAVATIVLKPPTDAEVLRKNPLGLYIRSLNWTRDLVGDSK